MACPSFRRRRLAGESGGGRDGYLCAWRRPRQERLQRGWAGCVRRGCDASQGKAGDADCSGGEASSVRCRDGGLLRGSSSRPRVRRPRPRRSADVARICPALHQGAEERRSRRRGDRGGGDPAAGSFLERALINRACGSPERLIFEAPPVVVPPLEQAPRLAKAYEGAILDTLTACPPLTAAEQAEAQ